MSSPSASHPPPAVFLSYAREDAAVARRLAEALRAGGVEVWFDENELRGGDAWDKAIRKQIRDCTLFLPIISACTQQRREGYFRLEWHLAEQRSLLISKGRPFLVPIGIDDTPERDAEVPEAFLAVQWMRLRDGENADALVGRVKKLLAGSEGVGRGLLTPPSGERGRVSKPAGSGDPALQKTDGTPAIPDYEMLRMIGRGSYGDVWLARGITGIYRAIKVVWRDRFADAGPFEREFNGLKEFAAISLGESIQLALLHIGRNDDAGYFYYVMELADDAGGGRDIVPASYVPLTLTEARKRRGRLPAAECVGIGVELARVLAGLHKRGLIHRDIKPSNIIIVGGIAKLADIGLVAPASDASTFVGTEGFVPPEGPGSPGADVFALGKVLYELATGLDRQEFPKLPAEARRLPDRRALFELNEIMVRACERDVVKRYPDGAAFLADLLALQAGSSLRGRRVGKYLLRWAALAAMLVGGGFVWWKWRPHFAATPDSGPVRQVAATAADEKSAAPLLSEAHRLVAQARPFYEDIPGESLTRQDFAVAEQLLKRALELAPLDGEVWAAYAALCGTLFDNRLDPTPARETERRVAAEKAVKLAPQSGEAWIALADVYRRQPATRADGIRILQEWKPKMPGHIRLAEVLAWALGADGRLDEALSVLDELPDDKPRKWTTRANLLTSANRPVESAAARQRALALVPNSGPLLLNKANIELNLGEVELARATLAQVPNRFLLEDSGANVAARIWLWSGEAEKCLAVLRAVPGDFVGGKPVPKTYLTGLAHALAGRADAARAEWRMALGLVDQRLARDGYDPNFLQLRAQLLAMTGQSEEAEKALRLALQIDGRKPDPQLTACIYAWLDRHDEAITLLSPPPKSLLPELRYSPMWQPLRGHPRFETLLLEPNAKSADLRPPSTTNQDNLSLPTQNSVAVLAFKNVGGEPANEALAEGIGLELISVLGRVPALTVRGNSSLSYFKGSDATVQEKGRKLDVSYLVEGSLQRAGNTVRIAANLTRAATNEIVWSSTPLTRDVSNIFSVQEEIAGLIAQALSLKLGAGSAPPPTLVHPQALELYLQARQAWNLRTAEGFARAEDLLNRSLVLDRNFARAHAALADVWLQREGSGARATAFGQRDSPVQAQIFAKIREALALDPNSAEAHASLGNSLYQAWQMEVGMQELRQAIALNPNYANAHHWLGRALAVDGHMDEAIAELKRAAELDPFAPTVLDNYAWFLCFAGRHREAEPIIKRVEMLQPNLAQAARRRVDLLLVQGQTNAAIAVARAITPTNQTGVISKIFALADVGLMTEAAALLPALTEESWRPNALAAIGRHEESIAAFTEARLTRLSLNLLFYERACDPIRDDPRIRRLLATVGATEAHTRAQAWRAAHPAEKVETRK